MKKISLDCGSTVAANFFKEEDILICRFSGVYGVGSDGNKDGVFISSQTVAALLATNANGVVLDFSGLDYSWGNTLLKVFQDVQQLMGDADDKISFPVAVVIGAKNRDGFLSLVGASEKQPEWVFIALEPAIDFTSKQADVWLDQ